MLRKLSSTLLGLLLLSTMTAQAQSQNLVLIGEGTRQNKVLYTFDSYKLVHFASSYDRVLSYDIERSLQFTMISEWGTFFTKAKMIDALAQALEANSTPSELERMSGETNRFKKTMLALPINPGTELRFNHLPGSGLQILMNGPRGFVAVFKSADQDFSLKILSVWLGRAHPDANNRENLESLIETLWKNAH